MPSDEGPLDTVGWGPFALFGERKRLREAEERRMAAVREDATTDASAEAEKSKGPTIIIDTSALSFKTGEEQRSAELPNETALTQAMMLLLMAGPWSRASRRSARAEDVFRGSSEPVTDLTDADEVDEIYPQARESTERRTPPRS